MIAIPVSIADKLLGLVFDFLKKGGESLVKNISAEKEIKKAIERSAERFEDEYPNKDLARTLTVDTKFYDLQSVQKAIRELLAHPFDPAPQIRIENEFAMVLPENQRGIANQAAQAYFEILREELIGVEKLNDKLKLIYLKRTAEAAERTASGVEELVLLNKTPSSDLEEVRRKYLDYIVDTNHYIDPRGLGVRLAGKGIVLDKIYISLIAEPELGKNNGLSLEDADDEIDIDDRYNRYYSDDEVNHIDSINLARAIRENARTVILGGPGAGKSTLLHFLAFQFANSLCESLKEVKDKEGNNYGMPRLPIPIRIAHYAEAFSRDRNLALRTFILNSFKGISAEHEALMRLLDVALETGNALVLLDGLDEIIDEATRAEVGRRIEEFIAGHDGNRFIITSRITGYLESPLAGDFSHFTLCDMGRMQIKKFLERWCFAVEEIQFPNSSDKEISERANAEIFGILKSIDENIGVRRLASNPLMLTMLVMIFREDKKLTSRRVELYEKAVNLILKEWQIARGTTKNTFQEYEIIDVLSPLAYWMHENRSSGMAREDEIKREVARSLGDGYNKNPASFEIQEKATDFISRLLSTGMLVKFSEKYYGFMHLTFEEYFVAREIVRQESKSPYLIYKWRHNPRWEEPIILAIAYISKQNINTAKALIHGSIIVDSENKISQEFKPSVYENILHRDLLFAIRVLSDCPKYEQEFAENLVKQLLEIHYDVQGAGKFPSLRGHVLSALSSLRSTELAEIGTQFSLGFLSGNSNVSILAIRVISELGVIRPQVVNALLDKLDDVNDGVREHASASIRKLGTPDFRSAQIINKLLGKLNDNNATIRANIIRLLGNFSSKDEQRVVTAILDKLQDNVPKVRCRAVDTLVTLDVITRNDVLLEILKTLKKDKDIAVRVQIIVALRKAMQLSNIVEHGLKTALLDSAEVVREQAAISLIEMGGINTNLILYLLGLLRSEDSAVRSRAAESLGRLDDGSEQVVDSLLKILRHKKEKEEVLLKAVEAIGRLNKPSPEVIKELQAIIKYKHGPYCGKAVEVFSRLVDLSDDTVVELLIRVMKRHDQDARLNAVEVLGKVRSRRTDILKNLILALKHDKSNKVRAKAATSLGLLAYLHPDVRILEDAMIEGLIDNNKDVRQNSLRAITMLHPTDYLIDKLMLLLRDQDFYKRSQSTKILGRLGKINLSILEGIFENLTDSNGQVRAQAQFSLSNFKPSQFKDVSFDIYNKTLEILYSLLDDPSQNYNKLWKSLWLLTKPV